MTVVAETMIAHEVSLAVWEVPTATAGGRFRIKAGAKSSAGRVLAGGRIEVLDGDGAAIGLAALGAEPWPGTAALYWTELELAAANAPGAMSLTVRFHDDSGLDAPHQGASAALRVSVVAKPEHVLTVTVASDGVPLEEAIVRLGAVRATTDRAGVATVELANGHYELVVWKAGYDIPPRPLAIEADTAIAIAARALPEDNPDAIWTA
jgi:hypothetical protein